MYPFRATDLTYASLLLPILTIEPFFKAANGRTCTLAEQEAAQRRVRLKRALRRANVPFSNDMPEADLQRLCGLIPVA